ncbi:hypothetical protein TRFO_40746 [Tritrichomonas foetus]|uniref:Uncharacterized protein n=1 Tax=Tritrichomonas foetus TaxID=1144522 RepID=A0A1J4IZZ9_9EUKA|nr:hypothetical protein TRFO_40746 [Tritrichomonas foetus]|eukprot:OHS92920.1 hypothetical protein TRFO_40746 [Tritrichomonas foetus]
MVLLIPLLTGIVVSNLPISFDISVSSINILDSGSEFIIFYNNSNITCPYIKTVNISGRTNDNYLTINTKNEQELKIELSNIHMNTSFFSPININHESKVHIYLNNSNYISSYQNTSIKVSENSELLIESLSKGFLNIETFGLGSSIGENNGNVSGKITFQNANVTIKNYPCETNNGFASAIIGSGANVVNLKNHVTHIIINNSYINASVFPFSGASVIGCGEKNINPNLHLYILNSILFVNTNHNTMEKYKFDYNKTFFLSGAGIGFGGGSENETGKIIVKDSKVITYGGDIYLINQSNFENTTIFVCGAGIGTGGKLGIMENNSSDIKLTIINSEIVAHGGSSNFNKSLGGAGIGAGAIYNENKEMFDLHFGETEIISSKITSYAGQGNFGNGSSGIGLGGSLYLPYFFDFPIHVLNSQLSCFSQENFLMNTFGINTNNLEINNSSLHAASHFNHAICVLNYSNINVPILYINNIKWDAADLEKEKLSIRNLSDDSLIYNFSYPFTASLVKTFPEPIQFNIVVIDTNGSILKYLSDDKNTKTFIINGSNLIINNLKIIEPITPTPTKDNSKLRFRATIGPIVFYAILFVIVIGVFIHVKRSERFVVEDINETVLVRYV